MKNKIIQVDTLAKHYVYEHYLDNRLFYVGKGIDMRAYDFKNRNFNWLQKVKGRECEIKVKIVAYFEEEQDAYNYEKCLIKKYCENGRKLENIIYNNNNNKRKNNEINMDYNYFSNISNKQIKINNLKQIESLLEHKNTNKKGIIVAICRMCKSMNYIEDIAKSKGYNPLKLQFNSNLNQIKTFNSFKESKKTLNNYDFLITNADFKFSNLKDEYIDKLIITTTDVYTISKTLGLKYKSNDVNKNINILIYKTPRSEKQDFVRLILDEKYINKYLTSEEKAIYVKN